MQQAHDDVDERKERFERRLDQVKSLILEHEATIFQGSDLLGWFGYWKESRMKIDKSKDIHHTVQRGRLVELKQEYNRLERDIASLEKSRFNMVTQIDHISASRVTSQLRLVQQAKEAERQQRLSLEKRQQRWLAACSARRQVGNNAKKINAFQTDFGQVIIQSTQVGRRLNVVRDFICCVKTNLKSSKVRGPE